MTSPVRNKPAPKETPKAEMDKTNFSLDVEEVELERDENDDMEAEKELVGDMLAE
jgi:hypothetical protein